MELLIPPGSETHSFEPTPKDIIDIQNCDLFIYTGGESEAWVDDVIESVGEGVSTVTLMDCVELLEEEAVEGMETDGEDAHEGHDHGDGEEYDEHVWTSPRNAVLICEKIAAALCEADPEGRRSTRPTCGVHGQARGARRGLLGCGRQWGCGKRLFSRTASAALFCPGLRA